MPVKVSGLEQARAGIVAYAERVANETAAQEVLEEALHPLAEAMERNLEPHRRTGRTIDDVKVRPLESHGPTEVRAEAGLSNGKDGRSFVGRFLENGTIHQVASPWARPALDETSPGFLDRIAAAWRKRQ